MGIYLSIIEGTPSEIFRTVTYCPSESLVFQDTEPDSEKIWDLLTVYSGHCEPCCATTKHQVSKYSGLIAEHTYTVLAVACLTLNEGPLGGLSSTKKERVVKLRNPWAGDEDSWSGKSRSRSSGKDR